MTAAQMPEATDNHKDVVVHPGDPSTLPTTYSHDQAQALHTAVAADQAQAGQAAARHLAPLEIHASETQSHTIHLEKTQAGKVVETDDIGPNGLIVKHATAKNGDVTRTLVDKDGKFIHSETDDKKGHKLSETQQFQNGSMTTKYDSDGHVVSTVTTTPVGPSGAKDVETVDKQGNVTTQQYGSDGKVFHSETHDKTGRMTRQEFDQDGKKLVRTYDKDGTETHKDYDTNGKLVQQTKYDKDHHLTELDQVFDNGGRFRKHFDSKGHATSGDMIDKDGHVWQHGDYDDQGRTTRVVNYDKGKVYDETRTKYDDKTGGTTETHIGQQGFVDDVKITGADGKYKEYGYGPNKEQVLYGEGNAKDGLTSSTDNPADPFYKKRPLS